MAKQIGQFLLDQGLLTKAQLETALRTQQFFGGHLGSVFIELGFLKEQALGDALQQSSGVDYAPPEYLEGIPPEVHQLIPAAMAEKHKLIPLRVEHGRLHLAMLRPKDLRATNQVSNLVGLAVVPYITPEFRIFEALERYYGVQSKVTRGITVDIPAQEVDLAKLSALQAQSGAAPPPASKGGLELGLDGLPMDAEFGMDGVRSRTKQAEQKTGVILGRSQQDQPPPAAAAPQPVTAPARSTQPVPLPDLGSPAVASGSGGRPADSPLADNARRLLLARSRDEIGEALLQVTERYFRRRLLFILQRDRIVGWDGAGAGVSRDDVKRVLLPMDSLSLFTAVKMGCKPMIGPVADVPANRRLFHEMRLGFPAEVVLFPIRIKDRVVAVFYGDNATQPVASVDVDVLQRITLQTAVGLEILLLRTKLLAI